jgi:surfactin synthase thioesterase subunit
MATWLEGTSFEIRSHGYFAKKNAKAKWSQLVQILYAKLLEFHNGAPLIVLGLSRSGRIARQVADQILDHEFEEDGLKPTILRLLIGQEDYVPTKEIKKHVESRSKESVSKTIGSVNSMLRTKLQLPKNQSVIDSKRGQGYRINPFYNLVLTD